MSTKIQTLKKGHYLAPVYQTYDLGDLSIGLTKYQRPVETGIWHTHERPMISMVLNGANSEYRKSKEIQRIQGSINYYNAHEAHRNVYVKFPSLHISLELEKDFLKEHNYLESDIELAIQKSVDAQFTFLRMFKDASFGDLQSAESAKLSFLSFVANAVNPEGKATSPHWMIKIKEILHDRWNENISLDDLSLQANVHPITISKNFRKYFSCTLSEYMRKVKVEHAIELLTSSKYTLTEVAYLCGFADQSHFTRVFTSVTGYLPRAFTKIL